MENVKVTIKAFLSEPEQVQWYDYVPDAMQALEDVYGGVHFTICNQVISVFRNKATKPFATISFPVKKE